MLVTENKMCMYLSSHFIWKNETTLIKFASRSRKFPINTFLTKTPPTKGHDSLKRLNTLRVFFLSVRVSVCALVFVASAANILRRKNHVQNVCACKVVKVVFPLIFLPSWPPPRAGKSSKKWEIFTSKQHKLEACSFNGPNMKLEFDTDTHTGILASRGKAPREFSALLPLDTG